MGYHTHDVFRKDDLDATPVRVRAPEYYWHNGEVHLEVSPEIIAKLVRHFRVSDISELVAYNKRDSLKELPMPIDEIDPPYLGWHKNF